MSSLLTCASVMQMLELVQQLQGYSGAIEPFEIKYVTRLFHSIKIKDNLQFIALIHDQRHHMTWTSARSFTLPTLGRLAERQKMQLLLLASHTAILLAGSYFTLALSFQAIVP
jgi:hypothetical protein